MLVRVFKNLFLFQYTLNCRRKGHASEGVGDGQARRDGECRHDRAQSQLHRAEGVAFQAGEHGVVHATTGNQGDNGGDHVEGRGAAADPSRYFCVEASGQGCKKGGKGRGARGGHGLEDGPAQGRATGGENDIRRMKAEKDGKGRGGEARE